MSSHLATHLAVSLPLLCLIGTSCGPPSRAPGEPVAPGEPAPRRQCDTARGQPGDFDDARLAADLRARVDEPELCETGDTWTSGGYIRVHGTGDRRFVSGTRGAERGCHTPPLDETSCPEVFVDAFGRSVANEMKRRGVPARGLGVGVCGDSAGDYDDWNFSVSVLDWKHAQIAVETVADELDRWGMGHYFGVSIRGPACGTPLERVGRR